MGEFAIELALLTAGGDGEVGDIAAGGGDCGCCCFVSVSLSGI